MPRKRKCPCGEWFYPQTTMHRAHCLEGALILDRERKAKRARKEQREAKERLKTRGEWAREAQAEFNAFIRARDHGKPCISCGRLTGAKINAGHYRSVGAFPELRFEERNVYVQCEHCNTHLSGNIAEYRKSLVAQYGEELVDWLEGPHEPKNYSKDDLKAIRDEYRRKTRELRKD